MKNQDASFVQEYAAAVEKIKAVLRYTIKENIELLSSRIAVYQNPANDTTSHYLASLQVALTNFNLATITYQKPDCNEATVRTVAPFALLSTQGNWLLVAWCRLRKDFRNFRLDRITKLEVLAQKFAPHTFTLQEYFEGQKKIILTTPDTRLSQAHFTFVRTNT